MLFSWWLNEIDRFKFVTPKYIILTKKNNIFIIIPKLIKSLAWMKTIDFTVSEHNSVSIVF